MTDVYLTEVSADPVKADAPTISAWAVIAGATAIAAITLILLAFGSAVGFSSVSPWSNAGISTTTFTIAGGLYLIVVAMLSSAIGGYIAGRLRHRWTGLYSYEIQFRDTAHGFLAWALATVIGAAALGSAATFFVGGSPAATHAAQSATAPTDYYADMLFRPAGSRPSARNAEPFEHFEVRQVFAHDLATGADFPAADRGYLATLVSARTGLNQADAEKRVGDVITQAKTAVDRARKAAAALSIWLAISMLVGAFSASAAALEGGQLRDRRWKGVIGARSYQEARIEG